MKPLLPTEHVSCDRLKIVLFFRLKATLSSYGTSALIKSCSSGTSCVTSSRLPKSTKPSACQSNAFKPNGIAKPVSTSRFQFTSRMCRSYFILFSLNTMEKDRPILVYVLFIANPQLFLSSLLTPFPCLNSSLFFTVTMLSVCHFPSYVFIFSSLLSFFPCFLCVPVFISVGGEVALPEALRKLKPKSFSPSLTQKTIE